MAWFLKFVALAAYAGTAMVSSAGATDTINWKMPSARPHEFPALGENARIVSEMLNEVSGGRVRLSFIDQDLRVSPSELIDALESGEVQAGYTWLGYDADKIPSSSLFAALPFGMEPREYTAWWYEGSGQQLGEEVYGRQNVHPILCGMNGPETAGWFRKKITSTKDFHGLTVRFAGLGGKVMPAEGTSLTVMPGSEMFQYFPGWHQTYTAFHLIINKKVWNNLEDQTKAMFNMACSVATLRSLSRSQVAQSALFHGNSGNGIPGQNLPLEMLERLAKLTQAVIRAKSAEDDDFRKVYESQKIFAKSYLTWKEIGYLSHSFKEE